MVSFTGLHYLCTFNKVTLLIYNILPNVWKCRTPSARPSLLMFRIDLPIARISSSLCCTGSLAQILSLWRKDRDRMDSHRASTMDVSEFPIANSSRDPWQQRCDSLYCHEEWWGSVPPSVVVFSWVHAITISSPKWKNHWQGPGTHNRWTYPCYREVNTEH